MDKVDIQWGALWAGYYSQLDSAGNFLELLIKTHPTATNAEFRLDFDEDNIKVWTEDSNAMITRTNSYIPNGNLIQAYHNYSYNDLFSEGAERTFYVQALVAGNHGVGVTYVLDGVDLCTNDLSVTLYQIDFVRIYDINKTANRTTRAVDATLRNARTYEDNERSDSEIDNNNPLLVAGGYGSSMDRVQLALQCQFAPASLGEHILWDIQAYKDCGYSCLANKDFSTGSIQNINLFTSDQENRARTAGQYDKDFKIVVGLDQNKDGVLSQDEQFDMSFNIRTIGKEEYEYCLNKWTGLIGTILVNGGEILYPEQANFYQIFLDADYFTHTYEFKLPDTVEFVDPYTQKNSLGCDMLSYTLGSLKHYYWNDITPSSIRIAESLPFWEQVIKPHIQSLNINEWYSDPEHSGINSNAFINSSFKGTIDYHGTSIQNLEKSLGECDIDLNIEVYTVRTTSKPQITGFKVSGVVKDIYDFDTHTGDEDNGYASRLQVCYNGIEREAGNIFKLTIEMDFLFDSVLYVDYDDLPLLRSRFLEYLWNTGTISYE